MVTLIDFGLAHKFLQEDGTHVAVTTVERFKGTWQYCSKNSLEKLRQTRRDDLESLFYMIARLCNVRLPWMPNPHVVRKSYF